MVGRLVGRARVCVGGGGLCCASLLLLLALSASAHRHNPFAAM
jgi:hypothetical protein